jgi:hypothetical protein
MFALHDDSSIDVRKPPPRTPTETTRAERRTEGSGALHQLVTPLLLAAAAWPLSAERSPDPSAATGPACALGAAGSTGAGLLGGCMNMFLSSGLGASSSSCTPIPRREDISQPACFLPE